MLHGQQLLRSGARHCPSTPSSSFIAARVLCRRARRAPAARHLVATVAATAAPAAGPAAGAAARKRSVGRPRKKDEEEPEEEEQVSEPPLPVPLDYQQTLIKSFTVGGVGLHSGEYAWVRVRPAFAGDGRYFVRVPEGTNRDRFEFSDGNLTDKVDVDDVTSEEPEDEDLDDARVEWFQLYLQAQDERGFEGSFRSFLDLQVKLGELEESMFMKLLSIKPQDMDDADLPEGVGAEPDLSLEPEDVVPCDPEDPTYVPASISAVEDGAMLLPFTQLGQGDNRVMTVELLLSALEACGVDNARIEIEGGHEIPVLDNSALGWCVEVQCAGMRPAPIHPKYGQAAETSEGQPVTVVRREVIKPKQAVAVQDEDGWIAYFPGPFSNVTFGVDHTRQAPVIGSMWYTWHSDDTHYRYSLAPARGYVESIQQLYAMRAAGFVKAGAENLFNIADGDDWYDPDMLRMVYDEPARYRIVQLIGNLSLLSMAGCQGIPPGHVTAHNASPGLQLAFVRTMLQNVEEDDFTTMGNMLDMQEEWIAERDDFPMSRGFTSQGVARGNEDLGDGSPAEHPEAEVYEAQTTAGMQQQQPEQEQQPDQQQQQSESGQQQQGRGRSRRSRPATPVDAEVLGDDEEA